MLLTARVCLEKGYRFSLACPSCRTLRVYYAGFAQHVIDRRKGDLALAALFEAGAFRCSRHGLPATFMAVEHDHHSTVDQIARWEKKSPAGEGGAS